MITLEKLVAIGITDSRASYFATELNKVAIKYGITGRAEASFVAQMAVESNMFKRLEEGLNYTTPKRLIEVYGSRCIAVMDRILGSPKALANFAYANRLGNGNEASGDGWRYRGRGLIQLTGFDNYYFYGYHKSPDQLMTNPAAMCEVAAKFWHNNGCTEKANAGDDDGVTRAINGKAMLEAARRKTLTLLYIEKNK